MNTKQWLFSFFSSQIGEGQTFASKAEMARFLDLPQTQATKFFNFLKGADTQYTAVLDWFDRLGGKLLPPDQDQSRAVCFVNAKLSASGASLTPPQAEDYIAVPLVEEAGAGLGVIQQEQISSWFMVWRHQESIRNKSNLIAVRMGKHSSSMEPTLHPGDIVLINRSDTEPVTGRMYLVMDPDGVGKIQRVSAQHMPKDRDYRLTFYSDNAAAYPPEVYNLNQDFKGDWSRAIVGRVLWAWSDVSNM
ncbi:MAG: S24/S26 family peptidase [Deltaproteobacteria bacterium]|jgi:phage repressor protein C with HTH and peptisase S24 domain|nr:S24/S26 family peptidase [Deltaproteobacteria bacterium]